MLEELTTVWSERGVRVQQSITNGVRFEFNFREMLPPFDAFAKAVPDWPRREIAETMDDAEQRIAKEFQALVPELFAHLLGFPADVSIDGVSLVVEDSEEPYPMGFCVLRREVLIAAVKTMAQKFRDIDRLIEEIKSNELDDVQNRSAAMTQ